MRLYATVTSERASKGQGGNERISGVVQNEAREVLFRFTMWPNGQLDTWIAEGVMVHETKGEKQKGETCHKCGKAAAWRSVIDGGYVCVEHHTARGPREE